MGKDGGTGSGLRPRELVAAEAPNRISDHLNRKARFNPVKSLRELTKQLTQEYEDRFLIELIQNAYDAHPVGSTDGRVLIRLDESDPGGAVLYVANTGRPFGVKNFDALTNVAQSSKPPGEGIGNKGIGFRSVLQVCESPEIYSSDPDGSGDGRDYDGFCFGFATDEQMRAMVAGEAQFRKVKDDFSRYLLPVVAESEDGSLRKLRAQGMVTVIRLPLTGDRRIELARRQIDRLLEPSPPVAIFLDRLSEISIERIAGDRQTERSTLTRSTRRLHSFAASQISLLETGGRRFLVCSRVVPAAAVSEVVSAAVTSGELSDSWADWSSDAEVCLAVDLDGSGAADDRRQTYTYLPMRVDSPVHAHLHAPFHTKMARLDFAENSQFNDFLLREAADLAISSVQVLAGETPLDLDAGDRRNAAVDLLCWDERHVGLLEAAAERRDIDLLNHALVPVRFQQTNGWAALDQVRRWDGDSLTLLSDNEIAGLVPLLDPALGPERIGRTVCLAEALLGEDLDPEDNEVASWAETIAESLEGATLKKWNAFLSEVATVFEGRDPKALQGRRILLDSERTLRRSGPWSADSASRGEPIVFLPPLAGADSKSGKVSSEDSLMRVPANLRRRIVFLHDGIRLRTGSRNERTAVINLLTDHDLAEPYELASIVEHIRRLLDGTVANGTSQQALSWVYRQEQGSRSNLADLKRIGLRVPTRSGWLRADQAIFSPGWKTPFAPGVAALVAEAEGLVPSIKELGDRTILAPADWPFALKDREAFLDFLRRAGVRDGLFPVPLRSAAPVRADGGTFTPAWISRRFGYKDDGEWADHVYSPRTWVDHPQTPYTGDDALYVVPGQEAFSSMNTAAKDRLASAVIESIGDWPDETFKYSFRRRSERHRNKPDPQTWPSPARTFVERLAWFPMSDPRHRDEEDWYFVPVAQAWTFDESTNQIAPRFARLAPKRHRVRLAASPPSAKRLAAAGLQTWNSRTSAAARLTEVAALLKGGTVEEVDAPMIRRAYVSAWSELLRAAETPRVPQQSLVVNRGSKLETVATSMTEPPTVYVQDVLPGLSAQVLQAGEFPVLAADPSDGPAIATMLEDYGTVTVRRTSLVEARVVLDSEEIRPSETTGVRLVEAFGAWLPLVLLATIDLRSSRFATITDQVLHRASAASQRIRIATGSEIRISVDNRTVPAKGRLSECLHLADADHPLIVANADNLDLPSWPLLARLSDDLADLLGQPDAGGEIRATALSLGELLGEWRQPTDAELAQVLRCEPEQVAALLRSFRASTDQIRFLLTPFVAVFAGTDAAERWDSAEMSSFDSARELLAELTDPATAIELLEAAETSEATRDLWRKVNVDLGDLNRALRSLNRGVIHFPDLHDTAMRSHVLQAEKQILTGLRGRYLDVFRARSSLSGYATARSLRDIAPDPQWLDNYELPDRDMLSKRVDEWLAGQGAESDASDSLPTLAQVRTLNRELLDSVVQRASIAVFGWCRHTSSTVPAVWASPPEVRQQMEDSGCLDFERLDEVSALAWFRALGMWPDGMDLTVDLDVLGLSPEDVRAGEQEQETETERRRRSRSEIRFLDQGYDTTTDDLDVLLEAVLASASGSFLASSKRRSKLSPIPPNRSERGDREGRRNAPGTVDGARKLSPTQTSAIGLLGELLAYEWLCRNYPEMTPACWVSGNRQRVLGGHAGDDTCGYDFEVPLRSGRLMFEVKATVTDKHAFDIGESELRAARSARKDAYRIIFISSILDPGARQLRVLPNPLEAEHADCFAQVNQGVRLRFDPA